MDMLVDICSKFASVSMAYNLLDGTRAVHTGFLLFTFPGMLESYGTAFRCTRYSTYHDFAIKPRDEVA